MASLSLKYTMGFEPSALMDHVQRHAARLHIVGGATEYEELADALFAIPRPPDVVECSRPDGDIIRFNKITEEYGVIAPSRIIRTYYVPVPCRTLAPANRRPGSCHKAPTNFDYFKRNCRRRYDTN